MSTIIQLFQGGLEQAWKAFIRPPRYSYSEFELGYKRIMEGNQVITRKDFEVLNQRKERI